MKKICYILLTCMLTLIACDKNDEESVTPGNISDISYIAKPGSILLKWSVPTDSNYQYVKVTYYDPWMNKNNVLLSSVYSDSLAIPNMLRKFGDYTFNLQTVSRTGELGNAQTINASALARPEEYTIASSSPIALTASMLSTNAQEPSEGPIENLLDGSTTTFFHSSWSSTIWPAYIQIDLDAPVNAFSFWYRNRANANGKPSIIEIYGSNDASNFTLLETINSGLPAGSGAEYTSPVIITAPQSYSHIRLLVTKTAANNTFFNMAELKLYKCDLTIYNPEGE